MRILVTGGGGNLASYAGAVFADHDPVLLTHADLDVRNTAALTRAAKDVCPDVILHLAALTDVDFCELHPREALMTNAQGTWNVCQTARDCDAKLVYVSTAGVFSGDKSSPYIETDSAYPANVYGWAKLAGEQTADLVVRSGWMFGGGPVRDRKFVGMIVRQIQQGATTVRAVDDKTGSPTYAPDLLRTVLGLLERDETGVFHGANAGVASRFDVACRIRDRLNPDCEVVPVKSDAFPLPAPRADSEAMISERLNGLTPRLWTVALDEYLDTFA